MNASFYSAYASIIAFVDVLLNSQFSSDIRQRSCTITKFIFDKKMLERTEIFRPSTKQFTIKKIVYVRLYTNCTLLLLI